MLNCKLLKIRLLGNSCACKTCREGVSRPEIGLHNSSKQMNNKQEEQLHYDHVVNKLSYRKLALKYGVHFTTIGRILMARSNKQEQKAAVPVTQEPIPDDIALLKEELRKAKLMIELQEIMLDIASKELGVDIRKKPGTRQSK